MDCGAPAPPGGGDRTPRAEGGGVRVSLRRRLRNAALRGGRAGRKGNLTASGPYVVEARGLVKRFGVGTVVDRIDLRVPRGGCFGLLGPNGAGKTTTLRMILGHSPPSGGTLAVLGESMPAAGRRVRARIGVVSQDDNLDPDFTVMENLEVYASYFPRRPLRPFLESLLEFVSLEDRAHYRIPTLSGGMRRRLVIARALVNDPLLLILDEPTTGLDPQIRHLIWSRLRALTERGTTVLLTTHYMEEAERLCDRVAIIDRGRILAEDAPRALVAARAEPSVIEVRAGERTPPPELLRQARVETVDGVWHCHTGEPGAVLAILGGYPDLEYLHRPANLEDVFLRLTGRELRD